ncbi:MAG: hypothetical protein KIT83_17330 [Bryobacterales bacterium]|nr:hypothetical protein [Bryobacterales bacterium]
MTAERGWRDRKVDRTAVSVANLTDPDDALEFWLTRSVSERLEALEIARRICHGDAAATARLQRVLKLLNSNRVECLLVGGYAVNIHGYVRRTNDLDVWVRPAPDNAERVL